MPGPLLQSLGQWWRRYKYRFVPWIAMNLSRNPRTLRYVPEELKDKVISDEDVLESLLSVFQALFLNSFYKQSDILTVLPKPVQSKYQDLLSVQHPRVSLAEYGHHQRPVVKPEEVLYKTLGFSVACAASSLVSAGRGVFVSKGSAPKGTVVSMYPGTVYQKHEPIFFQSIGNPFIFRCLDGILIDGNDKGISKVVYRSCAGRDRLGPLRMSDSTWLTAEVQNPLAVGQYVNNCSNGAGPAHGLPCGAEAVPPECHLRLRPAKPPAVRGPRGAEGHRTRGGASFQLLHGRPLTLRGSGRAFRSAPESASAILSALPAPHLQGAALGANWSGDFLFLLIFYLFQVHDKSCLLHYDFKFPMQFQFYFIINQIHGSLLN
ncbi:SET domain-containing protein 9 isoform 1-T1 [Glossophaga mutica]